MPIKRSHCALAARVSVLSLSSAHSSPHLRPNVLLCFCCPYFGGEVLVVRVAIPRVPVQMGVSGALVLKKGANGNCCPHG